jgi:hypothetical protein
VCRTSKPAGRFYRRALEPLGFSEIGPWSDANRETAFGLEEANDFAIEEV